MPIARPSAKSSILTGSKIREVLAKVDELRRRGVDVVEMHIGQPGLPPSVGMLEEFSKILVEKPFEVSQYTPTPGILEVREAIAEDYSRYSGVKVTADNVSVSTGSSEAILTIAMAYIDPGDKVVLMNPTYLLYKPIFEFFGARVVEVKTSIDNGYVPDVEALKEASRGAKMIVLVNPDNPTGATLGGDVVKAAVDLAVDNGALLIYDEAYRHIYYEGEHVYAVKYGLSNVVALNTFSKDPALPGWRLGYVVADEEFLKVFNRVKQYVNINPPTPSQYLGLLYLRKYKEDYVRGLVEAFRVRRDAVYEAFRELLPEARLFKPRAGLYIFPNLSSYLKRINMDDSAFSLRLLEEEHVAVVPGSAFGDGGAYSVRINFTRESPERLRIGVEGIARLLKRLGAY